MFALKVFFLLSVLNVGAYGHARIYNPVGRSSLWRAEEYLYLDPEPNFADDAVRCGFVNQPTDPGMLCGPCGDGEDQERPRDNEFGGKYYRDIIVANYTAGQIIEVEIDITINHNGHLELRVCPTPEAETQECFNQYPLRPAAGGDSKIPVSKLGIMTIQLALPLGLRCDHCVIQTNYRSSGAGAVQEYRACSDVAIY